MVRLHVSSCPGRIFYTFIFKFMTVAIKELQTSQNSRDWVWSFYAVVLQRLQLEQYANVHFATLNFLRKQCSNFLNPKINRNCCLLILLILNSTGNETKKVDLNKLYVCHIIFSSLSCHSSSKTVVIVT